MINIGKIKKMILYLSKNGLIKTIKRIKYNIFFNNSKDYIIRDGLYILKKNNKEVIDKEKEINIVSNNKYNGKDSCSKASIYFNNHGYKVNYYYINDNDSIKYNNALPLVIHEKLNKDDDIFKFDINNTFFDNEIKQNKYENKNYIKLINKNKKKIDLSIIILNYNNGKIIFNCVDSLIKYNSYNYKIIVVDNNSKDGSYEKLKKEYKDKIIILRNSKNGCSSGRNLGLKNVTTKYVMFLDSDQYPIENNWLDNYIDILNENRVIGWACGWFNKKGTSSMISDYYELRDMPPYGLYRTDIGYLGSGGMIVSTKKIKEINGFDEKYDPTGYEDTDISLTFRKNSFELLYCPYLGIIHDAHQTTKSGSNEHLNQLIKNEKYFINKWKNDKKILKYFK